MENKENPLKDKSYKFALRMVKLYKHLTEEKREFVHSKQFCVRELQSVQISQKAIRHNRNLILFINSRLLIKKHLKQIIGLISYATENLLQLNKPNHFYRIVRNYKRF